MKTTKLLTAVLLALGLAACDAGPTNDLESTAGGAEVNAEREAFIGTWKAISGSMTTSCAGYAPEINVTTANLTWTRGAGATELVAAGSGGFCPLNARVSGRTATVVPDEACTSSDGGYIQFTITRGAYTFTLAPDAAVGTEETSGTMKTIDAGNVTDNCSYQGRSVYQKAAE
jgi:hypothetical protein